MVCTSLPPKLLIFVVLWRQYKTPTKIKGKTSPGWEKGNSIQLLHRMNSATNKLSDLVITWEFFSRIKN